MSANRPNLSAFRSSTTLRPPRVGLLLFSIVGIVCGSGCGSRAAAPELHIESLAIDLGILEPGTHEFSVPIENRGGAPLTIRSVDSSCSCTVARAPVTLAGGAADQIQGSVHVGAGPGSARLQIGHNAPTREHVIQLTWFGKTAPRLVTSSVEISQRIGQSAIRELEISYPGGDQGSSLEYLGASGLPEGATLEITAQDPAALRTIPGLGTTPYEAPSLVVGRAVLRFTSAASRKTPIRTTCTIKVRQHDSVYELPLAIAIATHQGLRASPERLLFTATSFDRLRRIERKILVEAEGADIVDLSVARKPDFIKAGLAPAGSDSKRSLTVRVTERPPTDTKPCEIVLKNKSGSSLTIPVLISYDP